MRRYIDVCTPQELKLSNARQRMMASLFNPDEGHGEQQVISSSRDDGNLNESISRHSRLSRRSKTSKNSKSNNSKSRSRQRNSRDSRQKGKGHARAESRKVLLDLSAKIEDNGMVGLETRKLAHRHSQPEINKSAVHNDPNLSELEKCFAA